MMIKDILSHLPQTHPWRGSIQWFETIGSTNSHAKELAANGAPHGTVLIADSQSAGRGRLGRSFQSPTGAGIYMSVILRPQCRPTQLMHLTCAVAVAVCDAVEDALGFRPGIKWINDLVMNGKKLAGILTELSIDPKTGSVDYAVVGIGLNCTQQQSDFPGDIRDIACSAAMVTEHPIDRSRLAAAMLCSLENMSNGLLAHKETTMAQYRMDCITIGSEVQVLGSDCQRCGKALDIDQDGGLIVLFSDGSRKTVSSGEVSVRGMYGYI